MNVLRHKVSRLIAFAGLMPFLAAQAEPPRTLPPVAVAKLSESLDQARAHRNHLWRDTPFRDEGLVSAYIEIPRGERRKFEYDMAANERAVDRVMPPEVGGYPINYGFVPQTVSYDGDPFDALVLGPPARGGRVMRGAVVGLMQMMDDGVVDSKVVLSPTDRQGRPLYQLTARERDTLTRFFSDYKDHEGVETSVPGWGTAADGWEFLRATNQFFRFASGR